MLLIADFIRLTIGRPATRSQVDPVNPASGLGAEKGEHR